ncbi:4-hydroxythreonine-4-phosphate dehydrogenase PdxA [Candidatus Pelagibacter communis]|uniref:4-hydroxythreonine-4-phosphate dehydrogenase PdxA n=1 Tax=Pelagibacter ubique TaxID=198252 RepID=UPI00065B40A8|nr:4-hydroxythreonine-4-phosphate dehydrogenase PdxA [Candidatus Pelagibacter ubique]
MNFKPILIVAGEPNSVFFEIFFKAIKKNIKSPIILIASYNLLILQMKKLKINKKIKLIDLKKIEKYPIDNKVINLINVNFNQKRPFEKISKKSNNYIDKSFFIATKLIKQGVTDKLINGPISKKTFLNKKKLGITEYISDKFHVKNKAMLIYNKKLAVCPLTTHVPLKYVPKRISKNLIIEKIKLINNFYKQKLNFKPKIAVLGLNPHCETISNFDEDKKIISPAVAFFKGKKYSVHGPYSSDTIFLKQNRTKFDVIIGMYHDQVLSPLKTLFEYDAINITLGLPFIRISPDHGPNEHMLGKNKSNPLSLIRAISFLDKN